MELPRRAKGDVLLPPGELTDIRRRLRNLASRHDLTTVIAYAFDHRTRILPFIFADLRMAPAGVRALGSALADSGFEKTRIVLQQWNRNFRPSEMRLDGRIPDLFLVSSMGMHSAECEKMVADACRIDPAQRPLIIVGGPLTIYEPWMAFGNDRLATSRADVAVTGEEYILLQLLETLLSMKAEGETLRSTFERAKRCGALDEIPGLVYPVAESASSPIEELVDTGIQRMAGDLDELASPVLGYSLLEPPSNSAGLGPQALPAHRVKKHTPIGSILLTTGCKFRCSYCPIPAYNQHQHRSKSGERVLDELTQIASTYHIANFFGTDDNFLNDSEQTLDIVEPLARKVRDRQRPLCKIRWGTEATVHDVLRMQEHLPTIRQAGLNWLWMGVEDLTATLVKKGQSESKTIEAFRLLREAGIVPMPMMMHHDTQPLVSWKSNYGLINQLRTLRRAGAMYMQVLMLTPAPGSKWYGETYTSGLAFDTVGGEKVSRHIQDGGYVVASKHPRPWLKQLFLLAGYTYFFNPIRFVTALVWSKSRLPLADMETRPEEETRQYPPRKRLIRKIGLKLRAHVTDAVMQALGMAALAHTYRRTLGWAWKLFREKAEPASAPPVSRIPMRSVQGTAAAHALPGTPAGREPELVSLGLSSASPLVSLDLPSGTPQRDAA
ncbi:MAG: radical SAM protein [Planctomycetaceae bacterium]|nr:radical SAM protein [Planctomycetaceae bacterium]